MEKKEETRGDGRRSCRTISVNYSQNDNFTDQGRQIMFKQRNIIIAMVLASMLFGITGADACTCFFLKTGDNAIISGRTDEFYSKLDSKIQLVPRGTAF